MATNTIRLVNTTHRGPLLDAKSSHSLSSEGQRLASSGWQASTQRIRSDCRLAVCTFDRSDDLRLVAIAASCSDRHQSSSLHSANGLLAPFSCRRRLAADQCRRPQHSRHIPAACQSVGSLSRSRDDKGEVDAISLLAQEPLDLSTASRQQNGRAVSEGPATNGVATGGSEGPELLGTDGRRLQPRLRIAVDVDEVLGSFLSTLNLFCEEQYDIRHELHEFYVYDFMKIWKCSQEEANHRVHAFFESDHFNDGIPVIPGAFDTLRRLKHFTDLVVVTSRQHVIREPTLAWLDAHFPAVFSSVHFGNHFALEGKAKPKSDMCRELGAQLLIDDNPRYAEECAAHGIHVLLFDWRLQYPWSKTAGGGPHHPLITRVSDWRAVEVAVHQMAIEQGMLRAGDVRNGR